MNENPELCKSCKGRCCKNMPGCCHPDDFDNDFEKVKAALLSGRYTLDMWEQDSDPRCHWFVTPADIKHVNELTHYSWGNVPCNFLTPDGCELAPEQRPKECKETVPTPDNHCQSSYNKNESRMDWLKFNEQIEDLITEVRRADGVEDR